MVLAVTIWVKSLINLVVASILMDGIRKVRLLRNNYYKSYQKTYECLCLLLQQRLLCIAPWLINTTISIGIEIAVFVFMEIKMNKFEEEIALDRRIVHSVIFGVLMGKINEIKNVFTNFNALIFSSFNLSLQCALFIRHLCTIQNA